MTSYSVLLYRLLLRLVAPRDLREEYGESMEEVFAQLLEGARKKGWSAVVGVWFREVRQLLGVVRVLSRPDLTPRSSVLRGIREFAESFSRDLRLAANNLLRRPVFAGAIVLTMSVGIGLTLVVYSAARSGVLAPLPIPGAERLVIVTGAVESPDWNGRTAITSRELEYLERTSGALEGLAAFSLVGDLAMTANDRTERAHVTFVDPTFFSLIGARLRLGRFFAPEAVQPSSAGVAEPEIVLAHHTWIDRFNGDPTVIGRQIQVASTRYTVIGVMSGDHWGLARSPREFDAWLPLGRSPEVFGGDILTSLSMALFWGVGRLSDGTDIGAAKAELRALHRGLQSEETLPVGQTVDVMKLDEFYFGGAEKTLTAIGVGGLLVLLICGLNVAFLMGLRAKHRRDELSIRLSLGGSKWRIGQTLVAESVILALLGGLAALGVGQLAIRTVLARQDWFLRFHEVVIDPPLATAALVLALALTVFPTAVTALRVTSRDPNDGEPERPRTRAFHSGIVVAAESALAVMALVVATLSARSLDHLGNVELGYEPEGLESMRVNLVGTDHGDWAGPARFARTLVDRLEANSGVSVGVMGPDMMGRSVTYVNVTPEGLDPRLVPHQSKAQWISVTPGTLETLGIEFVAGRDVAWEDQPGNPLALVLSERTAKALWPGTSAIGKRVHLNRQREAGGVVVGVVKPARHIGRYSRSSVVGDVYFALQQQPTHSVSVLYRNAPSSMLARADVDEVIRSIDRRVAPFDGRPMSARLLDEERGLRLVLSLSTLYGLIALALALCGIVSLIATSAHERRREIAIRGALGGGPTRLVWTLTRGTLAPLVGGVGLGAAAALVASKSVQGVLFEVSLVDPITYVLVSATLVILGVASSWIPAHRSAASAPLEVMRLG